MDTNKIYNMDCIAGLKLLPDKSVNCCVTSPPYYGLRDYGVAGQIGLERTSGEYVAKMVEVFGEFRRVLRDDGTLWLNLADSYSGGKTKDTSQPDLMWSNGSSRKSIDGLKQKNLLGIPWRVAFALQDDGWYLRSDIVWEKPNAMPESVTDRPTKSHEYIFLLSKSKRYYYDADAIKEPCNPKSNLNWERNSSSADLIIPGQSAAQHRRNRSGNLERKLRPDRGRPASHLGGSIPREGTMRNKRDVWTVSTKPFKEAHFAVFPAELIEPCILAGCPEGGIVLDPFMGSGTVGVVAKKLNRNYLGIEIKSQYVQMAENRIAGA